MKIKEILTIDLSEDITNVIDMENIQEEELLSEIENYIVTDGLASEFDKLADVFSGNVKETGIWLSGFYGSGKSYLGKLWGYILSNPVILGTPARERILQRFTGINNESLIRNDIMALDSKNFMVIKFDIAKQNTNLGIALTMMENFFRNMDLGDRKLVVANGESLTLGKHVLTFVFAPMVHWPEVMVTYDSTDKVLFSADGFGKFGALDVEEDWDCEARRYYIGIVGKYGPQVQKLLKAASTLDIQTICPLHGPILTENLGHYIEKYDIWSSYKVEDEGVVIAYSSVYGNTKKAVEVLAQKLEEKGCPKVSVFDLARDDMAEAVEEAFRYGKLVLATITYNADLFPFMKTYIDHLTERNYQNRTIGLIENGSWAPNAAKVMKAEFEKSKNITWLDTTVKIMSSLSEENMEQLDQMAEELCK